MQGFFLHIYISYTIFILLGPPGLDRHSLYLSICLSLLLSVFVLVSDREYNLRAAQSGAGEGWQTLPLYLYLSVSVSLCPCPCFRSRALSPGCTGWCWRRRTGTPERKYWQSRHFYKTKTKFPKRSDWLNKGRLKERKREWDKETQNI